MSDIRIVLSSRNPSKIEQVKAFFDGLSGLSILSLDDAGIEGEAREDANTLELNAHTKALFAWARLKEKTWCIADDTGLYIRALNGAPGARAARWAGEGATAEDIMRHALMMLKPYREPEEREAMFRAVVAVVSPTGTAMWHEGQIRGRFLLEPRGPCQRGMPYSAIFVPHGETRAFSEMSVSEENAMSHRGEALRKVRQSFERVLGIA